MSVKRCEKCRELVPAGALHCENCGATMRADPLIEDRSLDICERKPERLAWLKFLLLGVFLAEVIFAFAYAIMK